MAMKKKIVSVILSALIVGSISVPVNAVENDMNYKQENEYNPNWYKNNETYKKFTVGKEYNPNSAVVSEKYLKITPKQYEEGTDSASNIESVEEISKEELNYQVKLQEMNKAKSSVLGVKSSAWISDSSLSPSYVTLRVEVNKWNSQYDVTASWYWNTHPGKNSYGYIGSDVVSCAVSDGLIYKPGTAYAIWENDIWVDGERQATGGTMNPQTFNDGVAVDTDMSHHGATVNERGMLIFSCARNNYNFYQANIVMQYEDQVKPFSGNVSISSTGHGSISVSPSAKFMRLTPNPSVMIGL